MCCRFPAAAVDADADADAVDADAVDAAATTAWLLTSPCRHYIIEMSRLLGCTRETR